MSAQKVPWINAIFACAMVESCSIAEAARKISAPHCEMIDAYKFRLNTAHGGSGKWITDYQESITESFKRLEAMN